MPLVKVVRGHNFLDLSESVRKSMKFILGTKDHMTQVFDEKGRAISATILKIPLSTVVAIKTKERDGYTAVQLGLGEQKTSRVSKAVLGHGKGKAYKALKEFPLSDTSSYSEGATLAADIFSPGDKVGVTAISKGKGFQGVVRRHGFAGGPRTHGQKHSEREPGSIGGGLRTRVPKGMRMAGRMGGDTVTVKNLKIVHVDKDAGELYISGAVPGRRGTLVSVFTI
ncbi:MAG: 50S ribosomal protein L3 [Patescibacteria group bacterium]